MASTTSATRHIAAAMYRCETCGAEPGSYCTTTRTDTEYHPDFYVHIHRMQAAQSGVLKPFMDEIRQMSQTMIEIRNLTGS